MPRTLKPCGTNAAYDRHLRHGETPCQPCRDAHAGYTRRGEGNQQYKRARQRALTRLAAKFDGEYRRLLAAEREARPGTGRTTYNQARRRALTRLAHAQPIGYQALLLEEMDAEREAADAQWED